MSIKLYGEQANRTQENHLLRAFIGALAADWSHQDKDLILIANTMWAGAEIDLVCILPSAILVVDFKHYAGLLQASENGPWLIDSIPVKGGSKASPFQQLRDNKFSVIAWFERHGLLQDRNIGHINAAVVFSGPITGAPDLSSKVKYWFHSTDLANCANLLADLASPQLTIYDSDIDAIISALGVTEITVDYGQTAVALPHGVSPHILGTENSTVASTVMPRSESHNGISSRESDKSAPTKSRLSSMFKTAAALGGLFVVMAVISQIYPSVGQTSDADYGQSQQSSLATQETQLLAQLPNQQRSTQPFAQLPAREETQPLYPPSETNLAKTSHITTNTAANYIGQSVTACGQLAQLSTFKKGVYLNFDKPYPQQSLTVVVWDGVIAPLTNKLGNLDSLVGKELCTRGKIEQYNQRAQLKIVDVSAIELTTHYLNNIERKAIETAEIKQPPAAAMDQQVPKISAQQAGSYLNQQVMACGTLAQVSNFKQGAYLNLDNAYPQQSLSLVLWSQDIDAAEASLGKLSSRIGQQLCALGTVKNYKQSLQLYIDKPSFLRLM